MSQEPGHSLEALRFFKNCLLKLERIYDRCLVGWGGEEWWDTHPPCSLHPVGQPIVFLKNKICFVPVSTISSQKQWPGCP